MAANKKMTLTQRTTHIGAACKLLLLLAILQIVTTLSFGQGMIDGFLKGKGKGDVSLAASGIWAEDYLAGTTELAIGLNQKIFSGFAAYGITRWLDVVATMPIINGQLQDGAVMMKFGKQNIKLSKMRLSLIGALGHSGPLARYSTEAAASIGQRATMMPLRGIVQITSPSNLFLNMRFGYNSVLDPTPNARVFSLKMGYYKNKFYGDIWYDQQNAIGGKDYRGVGPLAPATFRELGYSYKRIGGVVYMQFKPRFGAFANLSRTLSGRNAFLSTAVAGGVVFKIGVKG